MTWILLIPTKDPRKTQKRGRKPGRKFKTVHDAI